MTLKPYAERNPDDCRVLASQLIAYAAAADDRITVAADKAGRDAKVLVWSRILAKSDVYLTEGMEAIEDYYSEPGVFPIKPGDIVGRVKKMPVTSSDERFRAWLEFWSHYPHANTVQQRTGMHFATFNLEPDVYKGHFDAWVESQYDEIKAAMDRQPKHRKELEP